MSAHPKVSKIRWKWHIGSDIIGSSPKSNNKVDLFTIPYEGQIKIYFHHSIYIDFKRCVYIVSYLKNFAKIC